ncbi:MAG: hypothetical protein ACI9XO_001795 [Paraglaciecola sp.]|jgi:hypothetical protein
MNKFLLLTSILLFLFVSMLSAQNGYSLRSVNKVEIPFEYESNLIIIKATFQGFMPLKFIFDTGAEHTIISKREITDILKIPYRREFKLLGSDMSAEISAFLISGVQLQISDLLLPNQSMLVLSEDHLHLEEVAGIQIHGILGSDVFKRYVVRIDYSKKVITLYSNNIFKLPKKGFEAIDIEIFKNKPYLKETLWLTPTDSLPVKLLIDTGAALSLLIHSDSDTLLTIPEGARLGKLAFGLGGFIEGYLGRIQKLKLGNFQLNEVLTNFQDLNENLDTTFLNNRNGLIGNQALNRFDVILHYPQQKLYLRPNKKYKKAFEFDKSGLIVIATSPTLNKFTIHDVLKNSPGKEAGLQKGDVIKSINRFHASFFSLREINRALKKKVGKRIRMVVKRGERRMVFYFKLRKLV